LDLGALLLRGGEGREKRGREGRGWKGTGGKRRKRKGP